MMLRLLVVCGLFWGVLNTAYAEEPSVVVAPVAPAVLNDPPGSVSMAKDIINRLNPSYETVWSLADGTFSQGVSASLYNVTSRSIPIASVRAGFGTNEILYGGVSLDLPGLAKRYIPATIKGVATVAPLDTLWAFAGKYARVGVISGYSWGDDHPVYGFTLGAAFSF